MGELTSWSTGKGTFTFTGCATDGFKCKTGSGSTGEVTAPINLSVKAVSEKDYLDFEVSELDINCTVDVKLKGDLLIPATPEFTLSTTYIFNAKGSAGVQEPVDTITPHLEAKFAIGNFEHASLKN